MIVVGSRGRYRRGRGQLSRLSTQLGSTGRIEEATYAEGAALLGDRGMVELVALCGYYTMISFMLNAFEVPLPPRVERVWAG